MAQTVSIQRGSVTYTANGSTTSNITTLFTNTSSGNGTRVIVNYVVINNPYISGLPGLSRQYTIKGFLGSVSSGTTGTIHGYVACTGQTMNGQLPIIDPGTNFISAAAGTSSAAYSPINYYNPQTGNNEIGFNGIRPASIVENYSNSSYMGHCPRNFYIGPGDVVKWWPATSYYTYSSGKQSITVNVTQTLYYSFTCITES